MGAKNADAPKKYFSTTCLSIYVSLYAPWPPLPARWSAYEPQRSSTCWARRRAAWQGLGWGRARVLVWVLGEGDDEGQGPGLGLLLRVEGRSEGGQVAGASRVAVCHP